MSKKESRAFIGLDVHKDFISVGIAEEGREGDVYFYGNCKNEAQYVNKLANRLKKSYSKLEFIYEAGPSGYSLYRFLREQGYSCEIITPTRTLRKPTDRIKNDHRNAISLARLLRAGELSPIWVPDEQHEAIRDLVRLRHSARRDLKQAKQRINSLLLKHNRKFDGKNTWKGRHRVWLHNQSFQSGALNITYQTYLHSIEQIESKIQMIDSEIQNVVENWALRDMVYGVQALKGVGMNIAVALLAEIGDPHRFASPKELMAFLGMIPGEYASGGKSKPLGITKVGNSDVRSLLFEGAWNYQKTPKTGYYMKRHMPQDVPQFAKDISWRAQLRLHKRYKKLVSKGKKPQVAVTAIARELLGFFWAICKEYEVTPSQ